MAASSANVPDEVNAAGFVSPHHRLQIVVERDQPGWLLRQL